MRNSNYAGDKENRLNVTGHCVYAKIKRGNRNTAQKKHKRNKTGIKKEKVYHVSSKV